MVTPFGDQCAPSRSPLLQSGSSTTSANRAASPSTASAVSLVYSANSGQARKASVPMSSSNTNRRSLTGARYIVTPSETSWASAGTIFAAAKSTKLRTRGSFSRPAGNTAYSGAADGACQSASTLRNLAVATPWRHRNSGSRPMPSPATVALCSTAGSSTASFGRTRTSARAEALVIWKRYSAPSPAGVSNA